MHMEPPTHTVFQHLLQTYFWHSAFKAEKGGTGLLPLTQTGLELSSSLLSLHFLLS